MEERLVLRAVLTLAVAALLVYVGALVLRRRVSTDARLALRMFALWWFAVAAVVLLAGSHTLLYLAGVDSVPVHVAIVYLGAPPLAAALWALQYYLLYIYTGRRSTLLPLTLAYLVFLGFTLYYFASFGQDRLEVGEWNVRVAGPAQPPAWVSVVFALLLAIPVLWVAVAYGLLLTRTSEPGPRRRVALVSVAFVQWFGAVLVGYLLGWDRADWFPLVYETPGIVAGLLVVKAYG